MIKSTVGAVLATVGGVGTLVGKLGVIASMISWVIGCIGIIDYVSFWYVVSFIGVTIGSMFTALLGAALIAVD